MIGTERMTKRVLAIDDDETILTVMDNLLKMHDYEPATATQWVEALDAINERTPDLLLLDLQMPHVDGFFLLEWIREQELVLPVIVVSAYLDQESIGRLESLGVSAFIWKPFNLADLIGKIEGLIGKSAGGEAVAPSEPQLAPSEEAEPGLHDAVSGHTLENPALVESTDGADVEDEANDTHPHRRRKRRSRRGTSKRRRRRTALYLLLIAVISIGISSVSIYLGNVADSVEQAVEEGMSAQDDSNELLRELLRSQMETDRRVQVAPP